MPNRSIRYLLMGAALAITTACPGPSTCNTNSDCGSGQVCSAGKCVSPDGGSGTGGGSAAGGAAAGGRAGGTAGGSTAGGTAGGSTAGGTAGGSTAGGSAGGSTAGGSAGGATAGGSAGGDAGGTAGGSTAGGSAGGATAGGSAGGATAGGSAGGATAGGTAGGATAGGTAGGATAGGTAGGATAGGTAGGATAGGTAGGATAGGTAGGSTAGGTAGGGTGGGSMQASGETCASPIVLAGAGTYFGDLTDAGADYNFRDTASPNTPFICQGNASTPPNSPDQVFQIAVPAGQRLIASLLTNPDGGSSWDSILNVTTSAANCGTLGVDGGTQNIVCRSGSDIGNPEIVNAPNATTSAQDHFLLVKGYVSSSFGLFGLTTSFVPLLAGDVCEQAQLLDGGSIVGQNLTGYFNDYNGTGTGCTTSASGADRAFVVPVAPGQRATVLAQPDAGFDISLAGATSSTDCNNRVCVGTANAGTTGATERLVYVNRGSQPVELTTIVDAVSSTGNGNFDVSVSYDVPPTGDVCENAIPLTIGTPLIGESLASHTNDYTGSGTSCATTFAGLDRVFSTTIPANSRLNVTVTPGAGLNTSISLVAAGTLCSSRVCLGGSDNGGAGVADTLGLANFGSQPQPVFIIVDSSGSATSTIFDISATTTTVPNGDRCQSAETLPTNMTLTMQTTVGFGNEYGSGTNCSTANAGPDRVYSVDVPAGQRVTVTSVAAATFNPSLSLLLGPAANCDATTRVCVANNNSGGVGGTDVASWFNGGTASQTVFVIIDSTATTGQDFTLSATLDTPVAMGGDVCATAPAPITMSTMLTAQTLGGVNDYISGGTACVSASGLDQLHEVAVPAGQLLRVTATPTNFDLALNFIAGPAANCGQIPRVCLAGTNAVSSTTGAEVAQFLNGGATAASVFVSVEAVSSTVTTGTYGLNVELVTPAVGDTCSGPQVVSMNGTLTNQTLTGFNNFVATSTSVGACTYSNTGPDRVYAVTVAAGQTLNATVTPTTAWDPGIYAIVGPASNCLSSGSICAAGSDSGGPSAPDSITYTNNTATSQTVFVVVDRFTTGTVGDFSLTINVM